MYNGISKMGVYVRVRVYACTSVRVLHGVCMCICVYACTSVHVVYVCVRVYTSAHVLYGVYWCVYACTNVCAIDRVSCVCAINLCIQVCLVVA